MVDISRALNQLEKRSERMFRMTPEMARGTFGWDLESDELTGVNTYIREHAGPMLILGKTFGPHAEHRSRREKRFAYATTNRFQFVNSHDIAHVWVQQGRGAPVPPKFLRGSRSVTEEPLSSNREKEQADLQKLYTDRSILEDELFALLWGGTAAFDGESIFLHIINDSEMMDALTEDMREEQKSVVVSLSNMGDPYDRLGLRKEFIDFYDDPSYSPNQFEKVIQLYIQYVQILTRNAVIESFGLQGLRKRSQIMDLVDKVDAEFLDITKNPPAQFIEIAQRIFDTYPTPRNRTRARKNPQVHLDGKILYHEFLQMTQRKTS